MQLPSRSLGTLAALAFVGGTMILLGARSAGPTALAAVALVVLVVTVEWLVAPTIIDHVVRARVVPSDPSGYLTAPGTAEERVARVVHRRCRAAGLPLPVLGVADDDDPNAFTYGRSTASARVVVTTGLLRRLTDDELDSVVCHELGHVRRRDAVTMTVLAGVPLVFELIGRWLAKLGGDDDDDEGGFALFALAALLVSFATQFTLLAYSRSRELAADRWSCEQRHDGAALASALVKVATAQRPAVTVGAERPRAIATLGLVPVRASALLAGSPRASQHSGRLRTVAARVRAGLAVLVSTHPPVDRRVSEIHAIAPPVLGVTEHVRSSTPRIPVIPKEAPR